MKRTGFVVYGLPGRAIPHELQLPQPMQYPSNVILVAEVVSVNTNYTLLGRTTLLAGRHLGSDAELVLKRCSSYGCPDVVDEGRLDEEHPLPRPCCGVSTVDREHIQGGVCVVV